MGTQTKAWKRVSGAAGVALSVVGAGQALGDLELVVRQAAHLLASAACTGLGALPAVILALWDTLPLCALVHEPTRELFRVLVSSWSVILAIVGA